MHVAATSYPYEPRQPEQALVYRAKGDRLDSLRAAACRSSDIGVHRHRSKETVRARDLARPGLKRSSQVAVFVLLDQAEHDPARPGVSSVKAAGSPRRPASHPGFTHSRAGGRRARMKRRAACTSTTREGPPRDASRTARK